MPYRHPWLARGSTTGSGMAPVAVKISHKVLPDPRQVTRVNAETLLNLRDMDLSLLNTRDLDFPVSVSP